MRSKLKDTAKDKKAKEKSFYVSGDNLATLKNALSSLKSRRVGRIAPKLPPLVKPETCDCNQMHLTKIVLRYAPKSRKRGASNMVLSMTAWGTTGQRKRMKLPSVKLTKKLVNGEKSLTHNTDDFFKKLEVLLSWNNFVVKPVTYPLDKSSTYFKQKIMQDILQKKEFG